jgi:hypothetical protein
VTPTPQSELRLRSAKHSRARSQSDRATGKARQALEAPSSGPAELIRAKQLEANRDALSAAISALSSSPINSQIWLGADAVMCSIPTYPVYCHHATVVISFL